MRCTLGGSVDEIDRFPKRVDGIPIDRHIPVDMSMESTYS
jgi:hypothetical protein